MHVIKISKAILPEDVYLKIREIFFLAKRIFFDRKRKIVQKNIIKFFSLHGPNVVGGPFKGLHYINESTGSIYLPKLIGSYEDMLHPYFMKVFNDSSIRTIVDIGAAEGYYIAGISRYFPKVIYHAFEITENGRNLINKLLEVNDIKVDIHIHGEATNENVSECITDDAFIICDIEGGEKSVLDLDKATVKKIKYAIVELHEMFVPGGEAVVRKAFVNTHHITEISYANPKKQDYLFLRDLSDAENEIIHTFNTRVYEQKWLFIERKA